MLASGESNAEIARALFLSQKTVKKPPDVRLRQAPGGRPRPGGGPRPPRGLGRIAPQAGDAAHCPRSWRGSASR
ncbi:LuxR C-terminal-related transcriptional regulator [Nonomuraea sp. SYSU D8015]|uniref:LuxR C-terminal-related transcriptional regulator n=1 Tax=Nonomuraea sp. SYSU D8015 TaxID=2593644 RepID=UPI0021CEBB3B|nr:LuxR C-terminal-related transcriptional regulator [Nonomuraea sp. SYSU D8015]